MFVQLSCIHASFQISQMKKFRTSTKLGTNLDKMFFTLI